MTPTCRPERPRDPERRTHRRPCNPCRTRSFLRTARQRHVNEGLLLGSEEKKRALPTFLPNSTRKVRLMQDTSSVPEHQRMDAFELWCWRRLLRVPWAARRSNHSILKEISPGCSSEGLRLKLKLQYFGHLMRRSDSLEKTLMLGKIEGKRGRGQQRMRWLDGCEFE